MSAFVGKADMTQLLPLTGVPTPNPDLLIS